MADLHATIESTIKLFFKSYEDAVHTKESSHLTKALAPDCQRYVRPALFVSLMGPEFSKPMDNTTYEKHMAPQFHAMEDGRIDVVSTTVDTVKKTAVAHAEHHCKIVGKDSMVVEFVWILGFTQDGKHINKITEFLDCHGCTQYIQAMQPPAAA